MNTIEFKIQQTIPTQLRVSIIEFVEYISDNDIRNGVWTTHLGIGPISPISVPTDFINDINVYD